MFVIANAVRQWATPVQMEGGVPFKETPWPDHSATSLQRT
jgi:hypothetical protein